MASGGPLWAVSRCPERRAARVSAPKHCRDKNDKRFILWVLSELEGFRRTTLSAQNPGVDNFNPNRPSLNTAQAGAELYRYYQIERPARGLKAKLGEFSQLNSAFETPEESSVR